MKITLRAVVERADGTREDFALYALRRDCAAAPSSGLGLFLDETREICAALQDVVIRGQVSELIDAMRRCPSCSRPLGVKDQREVVYRTTFGKYRLPSPRLYSRCAHCRHRSHAAETFSPMASALPERSHPQWVWLQTRFASVMSYSLARTFLAHAFVGVRQLPATSIRTNVQRIGARLEAEVQSRVEKVLLERPDYDDAGEIPDPTRAVHALQVDAGYVRSLPQTEGTGWISVIASKIVRPEARRTHCHAYSIGYEPMQGLRQAAFLASVGIGLDEPVTVLCDGGEDVYAAGALGERSVRILDWFHIGMGFEHLLQAIRGLRGVDSLERERLDRCAQGAKWLLWHGQYDRCRQRLVDLRRDTGWVGKTTVLGKLIAYLERNRSWLAHYARRRAQGLPISSAGAESAVDYVVGQRMKRNGHMRWTRAGANNLLQVRCAALNGQDVRNFKRWYPPPGAQSRAA